MITINIDGNERQFDLDNPRLPDWIDDEAFSSSGYPYDKRLKRSSYEEQLDALHMVGSYVHCLL